MMLDPLVPWLVPVCRDLAARRERLAHALLLAAPAGSGKRLLAEHLARAMLCRNDAPQGLACGVCEDCQWIAAGNHPDLFRLIPESEQGDDQDEAEAPEDAGRKDKLKSSQILIDQVRRVQSALQVGVGGHAGGRRVVIVDPAEAMNAAAANALLKALEEPPAGVLFLLVSDAPRRLLATIRSRCQRVALPLPDPAMAQAWLREAGVQEQQALVDFSGGLPIAARRLATGPLAAVRSQLAKDLTGAGALDPLRLAAEWETRIKAKAAQDAGLDLPLLIDWLQRWTSDGVRVANGLPALYFSDFAADLGRLAAGSGERWLACYNQLSRQRRVASHPLNPRLFLEELWLTVWRGTATSSKE